MMMSEDERIIRPGPQYVAPLSGSGSQFSAAVMEGYTQMLGMLRDIRAEVQNLRRILDDIVQKDELADSDIREQEITSVLRLNHPLYENNAAQINTRLEELRELLRELPILYDRYGDEITHIENYWERANNKWPSLDTPSLPEPADDDQGAETETSAEVGQLDIEDLVRRARRVMPELDELIYHVGLLTIPGRLNQHLEQLRIGQRLDFHATFADEVPDKAARQKILQYLGGRPMAVQNGIIDVENGVVYHASSSIARRNLSYVLIALTVILGGLLTWLMAELGAMFELENWPVEPGNATNLLVGYTFVIAGGVVHIGVDAIKQARANSGQTFLALEDWLLWVHIHEIGIIIGTVSLWVGFFGLLLLMGRVEWQMAFLVGYSIDSFVDLFLQRFNTGISSRTGALRL
jgi:hypothetical protein